MNDAIKMQGIVQDFSSHRVLKGIDLTIKRGEIFGLLGPSGAGKTTIIKILTGQLRQTAGTATLLDTDTRKLSGDVNKKIGTMLDNSGLYERLSVYDNLKLFAQIYDIPYKKIDDVLVRTGLTDAKKTSASKLSKGMRGRLVLARAIINDAEILFLDEPTSGLDPATAKEIHTLLAAERTRGATIFLTTHNMVEAELLCDNVALLNQGELVEYGPPKEICQKYNYLNKLRIQLVNGDYLELDNDASSADSIKKFLKEKQIATIHSTEPNLESVFIERTGRGLV